MARPSHGLAAVAKGCLISWIAIVVVLGALTFDAAVFNERYLGGLERALVTAICGDATPDAQEAFGFGILYVMAPLTFLALLSLGYLLLRRAYALHAQAKAKRDAAGTAA
jgi:hypothetical protein